MPWKWTEALQRHEVSWEECKEDLEDLVAKEGQRVLRVKPELSERQIGIALGIEKVLALITSKERESYGRASTANQRPSEPERPTHQQQPPAQRRARVGPTRVYGFGNPHQ